MKITILTPVYNDWKSASKLLEEINTIVKDLDAEFSLVIVNDASTEENILTTNHTENLSSIEILNIKKNQTGAFGEKKIYLFTMIKNKYLLV